MCILEFIEEEAEQDDKEDVGEVKSDKLNKIIKKKLCSFWIFILGGPKTGRRRTKRKKTKMRIIGMLSKKMVSTSP